MSRCKGLIRQKNIWISVIAGGNGPPVLQLTRHDLDPVAPSIGHWT